MLLPRGRPNTLHPPEGGFVWLALDLGSASAAGGALTQRLDGLPLSRWHLAVFVICGLALFFAAMDQTIPTSAVPGLA